MRWPECGPRQAVTPVELDVAGHTLRQPLNVSLTPA